MPSHKSILVSNEFYELFRGDKDFIIPRMLAAAPSYSVTILLPNQLSLSDEMAGFNLNLAEWNSRLCKANVHIRKYQSFRIIRKSHNKRVPFLIPNPFSYYYQLLKVRPVVIVESIYTTLTPRSFLNFTYSLLTGCRRILLDAGDEARNKQVLPLERSAIMHARAIFTYNSASVERIKKKYQISLSRPAFIVHTKFLDPQRFQFQAQYAPSQLTIGYIGRFLYSKGFDRFIDLANQYQSNAQFMAVGINEDGFRLPTHIKHSNYIDNSQLAHIYSQIDIIVLPDLSDFKSFATVVQEALMCGCLVCVGTNDQRYYPYTNDIIFDDPKTGLPKTHEAIQQWLDMSNLDRLNQRRTIALRAHQYMDPQRTLDQLISFFN